MPFDRKTILPEPELPDADATLATGRALARDWTVGPCPFLEENAVDSELTFKQAAIAEGRIMQHAQVGFRDPAKSQAAYAQIFEACAATGVRVDRYGVCLDWSMGYARDDRDGRPTGTGLILNGPEGFAALTAQAPVAAHFGDFVLGFPAAVENTQSALAAGSTAIGNLGQYFTFRLPGYRDDVAATEATLKALGLIAAQPVDVLVHSNLDDGFAALFTDLASSLGAVLIEKHIVETLIGARLSHCYGHHFSDPLKRMAFQRALKTVTDTPGTMVYGNTVSYRGGDAENYASLSSYLLADIAAQARAPSGHAINPVPVRENERIPDIAEIIDAQLFAGRLVEHADGYGPLIDDETVAAMADRIVAGGLAFFDRAMAGLAETGIDTNNPFEMLLALRRIGGRALEQAFGAPAGAPVASADIRESVIAHAQDEVALIPKPDRAALKAAGLTVLVATTDVHEHGKLLVDEAFAQLGIGTADGGVSVDPDVLAGRAAETRPDAIALSTYNGVALRFFTELKDALRERGLDLPVLIGGRLNQIPFGSNTSLPVDVSDKLENAGAVVCRNVADAVPALLESRRCSQKDSG